MQTTPSRPAVGRSATARTSAEGPAETTAIPLERTKRALDILSGFAVVAPAQQGRNTGRFEVNPPAERTGDLRERAWAALVVAPPGFEGQEASMSESTSAREALDIHGDATGRDDDGKLELACRFIDEQGLLDEFEDFLKAQAGQEGDEADTRP